ncbi:unnamed protein product [Rotaria sordida]|uniref:Reelin domain-containing protein n=1 Tax=Rotaria sordida TaxID=392033 RepID=A0A819UPZ2_9BILA|nr:unnamed protein product [Rotaria sordida]
MLPRHGVSSQQCSSKYLIESDKLQYHTSDTVRITVRGSTNDDTFRGILLVAKTKTNQQIIGTWSVVGSDIKTLNCGGIDNTGITHNSPSDKSSIEALWHPPSTIIEDSIVINSDEKEDDDDSLYVPSKSAKKNKNLKFDMKDIEELVMTANFKDASPTAQQLIKTIVECKSSTKYIKKTGLNKEIQEAGGLALRQAIVVLVGYS